MRVGQNPAKFIDQVAQPAKITVAIVTYIPFLGGYYAESLEVLKACLGSIWENTDLPYDLMVFDNASCQTVRQFLLDAHQQGQIQYLILSDKNIGKGGAWNVIFAAAPGDIVAYADSDVYFSPGWLEQSLKILEAFPNVGMVTGRPAHTPENYFTSTLEWARRTQDTILEYGKFIPWETFKEDTDSRGISEEQASEWYKSGCEYRVTYRGHTAHIGASHFQFITRKSILQSLLPFQMDRPMGQVRLLDIQLNDNGYLRLSTCTPLVKHLGNRLGTNTAGTTYLAKKTTLSFARRFLNLSPVRRSLMKFYNWIFRLYYSDR